MSRLISVVAVVCGLASSAFGWNPIGHEAIAQIAYDQLTDAERAKVTDILKSHPRYDKDLLYKIAPGQDPNLIAFLQSASWPDTVRSLSNPMSHTENHPSWHYVDYPYHLDGKTGPDPVETWDGKSDPANLLQAMQKITAEMKDPKTPADRRAIDVCWVMHLVGDIHQPLHAVSLYSDTYPDGDRGGNQIHVATGTNPNMNLHAVWDNMEGVTGRDYHADPNVIRKTADRIEKDHPTTEFVQQLTVTDPKAWALDSFGLAKSAVYLNGKLTGMPADQAKANPDTVPPLPAGYETDGRKVADVQIALAGYRLAAVLRGLTR